MVMVNVMAQVISIADGVFNTDAPLRVYRFLRGHHCPVWGKSEKAGFSVTLPLISAYKYFAACMPQGNVVHYRCFLSKDW